MDNDYRLKLEQIYVSNYNTYQRLAARLLRNYTNQTANAEDIVENAFVLATEKAQQSGAHLEMAID